MANKRYFSMEQNGNVAELHIYGEITSFPWADGDVSSENLSRQLEKVKNVSAINVYINSYGGEVGEGLAIYNALKRHKAKVKTYCDGFAASIASVIFMAGDERVMNDSSLMMIHNAWSFVEGNAKELRKQADDLDKITQASVVAYKAHSDLTEDEIKALMDAETWILPEEAIEYGFATSIEKTEKKNASQNAKKSIVELVKKFRAAFDNETDGEDETEDIEEAETDTEAETETESEEENETDTETAEDTETDTDEAEEIETETETEETENETDEESDEETDTESDEENENPAQIMARFFNAILKN